MKKKLLAELPSNHHTFRVAPPAVDRESRAATQRIRPSIAHAIECSIKTQLLTGAAESSIEVCAVGLRPIRIVMKRIGDTAVVAVVIQSKDSVVESLTVCCAGLDRAEDEAALNALAQLLTQHGDDDDEVRETVTALIEHIRQQPRPHAVHIHLDETSFDDASVWVVTHCLAESFFDLFGIEKSRHATDV